MSALVILVNTDRRVLRLAEALLCREGCLVAALSSFEEATHILDSVMPDLLNAGVDPAHDSGLQLAIRNHHHHPEVPVIITTSQHDARVEDEAKRCGAAYVFAPLENAGFMIAVHSAIARRRLAQRPVRRWLRRRVNAVVELDAADTRATIVDVSYGGLRLAFRDTRAIPETFEITLPTDHSTITVNRVWTADSPDEGLVCCGAVLMEAEADRWREFVNSVEDRTAP
jgi:FixJ family two-component response regulator